MKRVRFLQSKEHDKNKKQARHNRDQHLMLKNLILQMVLNIEIKWHSGQSKQLVLPINLESLAL